MIRLLSGTIVAAAPTEVVLDVHGVGYRIMTDTTTLTVSDTATFYTHLAVRETALDLYGFLSPSALDFFELLLTVPKVGPKSAMQIMSGSDVTHIQHAIAHADSSHFKAVTGVGGKTAENIIAQLKDKVSVSEELPPTTLTSAQQDALDTLLQFGVPESEARSSVLHCPNTEDVSAIVTYALNAAN
jgi:Holliday junction DNA helicase RuvA